MVLQIVNPMFALTASLLILIYIFYRKPKGKLGIIFILLILSFLGINISEILILNFIYPEVFIKIMYSLVIISIAFFLHFVLTISEERYLKKIEVRALIYIFPLILIFLTLFTKDIIMGVDFVYVRSGDEFEPIIIMIYLNIYGLGLLFIYSFLYTINASGLLFLKFLNEKLLIKKRQIKTTFIGTIPFAVAYPLSFSFLKLFSEYFTPEQLILIDLITHLTVLLTYILFSLVVLTKILIIIPKKEVGLDVEKIARCGIDCSKCESFKNNSCMGCIEANTEEIICDIFRCADNKGFDSCLECFDFEDCRTFRETIHKRPGRKLEKVIEGTYIIKEEIADEGFELFKTFVIHGGSGLCISRTHPLKIREKYKLKETPVVWLSITPDPDSSITTINPTDLATLINAIKDFLTETKSEGVILIDGIEYLSVHNGPEAVAKMIQSLNEFVVLQNARLIITLNPKGIDKKIMTVLEREMKIIDKMPKKFRCKNCNIIFSSFSGICNKCKKKGEILYEKEVR